MGAAYYSNILLLVDLSTVITFIYLLVLGSVYIVLLLTDLKYRIIPNKIVYPAIVFVLLFMVVNASYYLIAYYNGLKNDPFGVYLLEAGYFHVQAYGLLKSFGLVLLSSTVIAAFFALLVHITKGKGMGGGDIRLGFLIGLFNGFPQNVIAIFTGFVLGASVSLILVSLKIKSLKDTVPFGPFLILGSLIAMIWGVQIWNFYINLF